ncbi:hypothetical protein O3P69_012183 [Scylla paramamosain]|uniref:BESS domain-containing protein n=1 Tax=Scylla paramamosain TaxID=85552 RepID=A0AAW0TCX9_SCYPA
MKACDLLVAVDGGAALRWPRVLHDLLASPLTRQVVEVRKSQDFVRLLHATSTCRGNVILIQEPDTLLAFARRSYVSWDYDGRFVVVGLAKRQLVNLTTSKSGRKTKHIVGLIQSGRSGEWEVLVNQLYYYLGTRKTNTWDGQRFTHQQPLFPEKLGNFQGSSLRAVVLEYNPAVFYQRDGSGAILDRYGLDMEVLHTIARFLNFSVQYLEVPQDAPQNSSPSVVIETPDNVFPEETAGNTKTCEDRTVKPILPMSKKPGVTKKRSRDTADEMDMSFLYELKQLREQASSQNVNDPDRQIMLSLLPMMKQLSPIDNMDIKIEIYETFRRKMFKSANSVQYGYWTDQNQSRTITMYIQSAPLYLNNSRNCFVPPQWSCFYARVEPPLPNYLAVMLPFRLVTWLSLWGGALLLLPVLHLVIAFGHRCCEHEHTLVEKNLNSGRPHDAIKREKRRHAFLEQRLYNPHSTTEQDV